MLISVKSQKAIYSSLVSEIARMENKVVEIKSTAIHGREELLAGELSFWETALADNIEALEEFQAINFLM